MKMLSFSRTILFGVLVSGVLMGGCKKDEEPTTEELLHGDWNAVQMFYGPDDFIALSLLKNVMLEFDEDGDFRFTGEGTNPVYNFNGVGKWEVDGDFIEITFNANSDTFCGDGDHRFSIDFDGEDDLTIEDVCSNGNVLLKIYLDKKQ